MFTDVVGYTAPGQKNEQLSLALIEENRKLIRLILARHNGREIETIGDAFSRICSALDSVRCAYDTQRGSEEFNFSIRAGSGNLIEDALCEFLKLENPNSDHLRSSVSI